MTRQGSVLVWSLVLVVLAGSVAQLAVQRWHSYRQHMAVLELRQQARLLAEGARHLEPGAHISYENWVITHHPDGRLSAHDGEGSGWWMRLEGDLVQDEGPWEEAP